MKIDMENLNDENIPRKNDADEIDALLSSYNSSLSESHEPSTTEQSFKPPVQESINTNWQGNPAYYQKGKKAGKLRPSQEHKAPPLQQMELSGTLIDGAMFLFLINLLVPALIALLNNRFSIDKISADDLAMTATQKKDLEPIAAQVTKYLSMKANPVVLLLVAVCGIFGMNFMAAKMKVNK